MHSSSCAAAACGTGFSVATAWAAASGGKDHRDTFDQGGSVGIESAAARAAALRSAYPGMQGFLATRTSGAVFVRCRCGSGDVARSSTAICRA